MTRRSVHWHQRSRLDRLDPLDLDYRLGLAPYTDVVYIGRVINTVYVSDRAQKELRKVPRRIADKLWSWVDAVETNGLEAVRRVPGYHDEPLRGQREGQRSIRLSGKYRAIYVVLKDDQIEFVSVEEVTAHDY